MTSRATDPIEILRRFAPGTPLRHAAELILRQGSGALLVIGTGSVVDDVCSGGFFLDDAPFSAQRTAELSKMDGGIVVDDDASTIIRANVHFIPDPNLPTQETGTRFRTAERLAVQTEKPILAVSEEGRRFAVVYFDGSRYELRPPTALQAEANQNLNSLERLRRRLDEAEVRLTHGEVDDVVTVRDVIQLIQRAALVDRLHGDVERTVVELGGEGRLVSLQAADLADGVEDLAQLVFEDYARRRTKNPKSVFERLDGIATEDLYDTARIATSLSMESLDSAVRPRGLRALEQVPRLPENVKDALISHFRNFQRLMQASAADLDKVDGVGRTRALQLRTYLDRLSEMGSGFESAD